MTEPGPELLVAGLVVAVAVSVGLAGTTWALARIATASVGAPPALGIALLLAVLTLAALVGFVLTGSDQLAVVVGTGIGGIAGAVQAVYGGRDGR